MPYLKPNVNNFIRIFVNTAERPSCIAKVMVVVQIDSLYSNMEEALNYLNLVPQ